MQDTIFYWKIIYGRNCLWFYGPSVCLVFVERPWQYDTKTYKNDMRALIHSCTRTRQPPCFTYYAKVNTIGSLKFKENNLVDHVWKWVWTTFAKRIEGCHPLVYGAFSNAPRHPIRATCNSSRFLKHLAQNIDQMSYDLWGTFYIQYT